MAPQVDRNHGVSGGGQLASEPLEHSAVLPNAVYAHNCGRIRGTPPPSFQEHAYDPLFRLPKLSVTIASSQPSIARAVPSECSCIKLKWFPGAST
jgi:hypothetical protein